MKSDRKPPLPKSPIRLQPSRVLRSSSSSLQTPPGSLTKSKRPNRCWDNAESDLRPEIEYRSISCDLRDLARMVRHEFSKGVSDDAGKSNSLSTTDSTPLFERGRFYEEYSARRNERLRKKNDKGVEKKTAYNLGVSVESAKRISSTKKFESLRKSVSAAYNVGKSEEASTPRYVLRSTMKENKKPPRPLPVTTGKSTMLGARPKTVVQRFRRD